MTRHAAVLGKPVAHSLSPALHRAAYRALGLDWSYTAIERTEAELPFFLDQLDQSWVGLSLTMPLKRVALTLADTATDVARAVGGANTLVLRDGLRHADNTDVHGIATALREAGVTAPASATVLGGGATAGSALAALRELGLARATLLVRDRSRAGRTEAAAERLGVDITVRTLSPAQPALAEEELVLSTLPPGAADDYATALRCRALFDVVYATWPTRCAAMVAAHGGTIVSGLSMLLHQAVAQVELMTTRRDGATVDAMRAALRENVRPRP
ncbi:shikimate dehydrogenase [Streptomyces sp. NPDC060223]|uniref:shikimate dehydrogenase n=1 Tax=unclassified Streptomyces TaxID=2593676 RepID=UPI003627AD76